MFEAFEEAGTGGEADGAARVLWHVEPGASTQDVRKDGFRYRAEAKIREAAARAEGVAVRTAHRPRVIAPGVAAQHTVSSYRFAFATGRRPENVRRKPGSEARRYAQRTYCA